MDWHCSKVTYHTGDPCRRFYSPGEVPTLEPAHKEARTGDNVRLRGGPQGEGVFARSGDSKEHRTFARDDWPGLHWPPLMGVQERNPRLGKGRNLETVLQ